MLFNKKPRNNCTPHNSSLIWKKTEFCSDMSTTLTQSSWIRRTRRIMAAIADGHVFTLLPYIVQHHCLCNTFMTSPDGLSASERLSDTTWLESISHRVPLFSLHSKMQMPSSSHSLTLFLKSRKIPLLRRVALPLRSLAARYQKC